MTNFQIDRNKWSQYSIFEQMGNISSEVGRAIAAKKRGNEARMNGAIDRALDLFDASIEVAVMEKSPRLREILLARDEFARLFFDDTFDADADALERYFMAFAIAARKSCDTGRG